MENEKQLVKQDLSQEDIKTLTEVGVIPKDCSPELVKLYGRICHETQLNPFRRQIHFIRRGYSYTVQVGIDGYRSIADRTGLYAGSDDYSFEFAKEGGLSTAVTETPGSPASNKGLFNKTFVMANPTEPSDIGCKPLLEVPPL